MRKLLAVLLVGILMISTGCGKRPPVPKPQEQSGAPKRDEGHLVVEQQDLTLSVGKIKYFSQEMIPAEKGQVVAGVAVAVTNRNKTQNLHMDPKYFTISTNQGKTYQYSPAKTQYTGKGALIPGDLPPDFRINGLILYEIPKEAKVKTIHYKDASGHQLDIKVEDIPSGV